MTLDPAARPATPGPANLTQTHRRNGGVRAAREQTRDPRGRFAGRIAQAITRAPDLPRRPEVEAELGPTGIRV